MKVAKIKTWGTTVIAVFVVAVAIAIIGAYFRQLRPKVLIVGVDYVPFDFLMRTSQDDRWPTLNKIMREGTHGRMKVVLPVNKESEWNTALTGVNPGKHGVFAARRGWRKSATGYELTQVCGESKTPLLNKLLTRDGGESFFTWIPFPNIGMADSIGYATTMTTDFPGSRIQEMSIVREAYRRPMTKIVCLFWYPRNDLSEFPHSDTSSVCANLRDQHFNDVLQMLSVNDLLLIVSTRLERGCDRFVNVNDMLSELGESLDGFVIRPWSTYGAYFELCPVNGDKNDIPADVLLDVRKKLAEQIRNYKLPGETESPFASVHTANELYQGPYARSGPDVVAIPKEGYYASASRPTGFEKTSKDVGSTEIPEGFYIAYGGPIAKGKTADAWIGDIAPTILYLLGQPIPGYMDGDVIRGAISDDYLKSHPIRRTDEKLPDAPNVIEIDSGFQERQLRDAGYLGGARQENKE